VDSQSFRNNGQGLKIDLKVPKLDVETCCGNIEGKRASMELRFGRMEGVA
jgi:hypothetical protein